MTKCQAQPDWAELPPFDLGQPLSQGTKTLPGEPDRTPGERRFIYFVDEMIRHTPRVYLTFCLVSLPTIWTNFTIPLSKSIPSQPALTAHAWVRSQQLRFQSDLDNLLTPWSPVSYLWDSFACPATFKKTLREFYNVSGSIWAPSKNDNCWGPLLGWLPSPDHTPLRTASPTSSPGPQQLAHLTCCWAPGQSEWNQGWTRGGAL